MPLYLQYNFVLHLRAVRFPVAGRTARRWKPSGPQLKNEVLLLSKIQNPWGKVKFLQVYFSIFLIVSHRLYPVIFFQRKGFIYLLSARFICNLQALRNGVYSSIIFKTKVGNESNLDEGRSRPRDRNYLSVLAKRKRLSAKSSRKPKESMSADCVPCWNIQAATAGDITNT